MLFGNRCCATGTPSRRDAFWAAGLTLGSALVIAAIMTIGRGPLAETIALTMFPGVLVIGPQALALRGRSPLFQIAMIGGLFLVLFLIGLVTGLVRNG